MTFTKAALAIDGARTPASLARLGLRASVKESGIINVADLKVRQLASPGNGIRFMAGGAAIENRYVANSGQMYVVENVDELIVNATNATNWPATNPGVARSHLACVSIGDPQYSTAGHPWLTDGNKPANPTAALDFSYVRPMIIPNVPAGTRRIEELVGSYAYPVYALSRLDLPSNWTSIADAQIIDLREVVNPRQKDEQWNVALSGADVLNVSGNYVYETWPDEAAKSIYVPKWATICYVEAWIYGFVQGSSVAATAPMRVAIRGTASATATTIHRGAAAGRYNMLMGNPMAIPSALRGTSQIFETQASYSNSVAQANLLATDASTAVMIHLRFAEQAD